MRGFIAVLLLMFLGGCTSLSQLNPPAAYYEAQIARIEAAQALAEKPMVEIECETGCKVSVLNPNGASSMGRIDQGTTAGTVALATVKGVGKLGKSLGTVRALDKIMSAVGDRSVTINGDSNSLDMDNTEIATTNSKSSTTSGNVTGDTAGNTTGDSTGDTTGATSGDVVTSGDVRGDETISGDVRGDEVNDSYNSETSSNTSTDTATTTTTTDNSTDTNDENSSTNTTTESSDI